MKSSKKPRESRRYRKRDWNYSWPASYFITLVTLHRELKLLGEIIQDEMQLSEIGEIVLEEWQRSFEIRKEIHQHIMVIMPDHLHALISINDSASPIESLEKFSTITAENHPGKFGVAYRPPRSVSSFVAGFKAASTARINQVKNSQGERFWAPRFHVRIIESREEFENVFRYIKENPRKKKKGEKPRSGSAVGRPLLVGRPTDERRRSDERRRNSD